MIEQVRDNAIRRIVVEYADGHIKEICRGMAFRVTDDGDEMGVEIDWLKLSVHDFVCIVNGLREMAAAMIKCDCIEGGAGHEPDQGV